MRRSRRSTIGSTPPPWGTHRYANVASAVETWSIRGRRRTVGVDGGRIWQHRGKPRRTRQPGAHRAAQRAAGGPSWRPGAVRLPAHVPFSQRFRPLDDGDRRVYFAAVVATAAATLFLIAPTAHHRLRFRSGVKEQLLHVANVFSIIGLALLAFAVTAVTFVITDVIYPGTASRSCRRCAGRRLRHRLVRGTPLLIAARERRSRMRRTAEAPGRARRPGQTWISDRSSDHSVWKVPSRSTRR